MVIQKREIKIIKTILNITQIFDYEFIKNLFLYTKIIDWSNQNIEEIIDDILHDKYKQNIKKYYNRIYGCYMDCVFCTIVNI